MHGSGDDNEELIAQLTADAEAQEGQAFVIGEGDLQPPQDLLNPTNEPLPGTVEGLSGLELPADFGAIPPAEGGAPEFGGLGEGENANPLGDLAANLGEGGALGAEPFAAENFSTTEAVAAAEPAPASGELLGSLDEPGNVDELLAAAVVGDGEFAIGADAALLPLDAPAQPTFSVEFPGGDPALKPKVKELATKLGLELPESAWTAAFPVISQLTEYQAVMLARGAEVIGLHPRTEIQFPLPRSTEDDLALGELASIPEPAAVSAEGAPSVALPAREKDVLLFTGDALPGFSLLETKGPVVSHRSIARRLFADAEASAKMERELARVSGRSAAPADSHLQLLFRDLFVDLRKQALAAGANAVLSLRVETFPETEGLAPSSQQLRLLVSGTAAVVDKS